MDTTTRTRVLVVDDHQTFAELLVGALEREGDFLCLGRASTGGEAARLAAALHPDVVVMDIELPDIDGIEATSRIVAADPGTRVVILTAHTTRDLVTRAAEAGACGFLPKGGSLQAMLQTLRSARRGSLSVPPQVLSQLGPVPFVVQRYHDHLTTRERDVLALMGAGHDARRIARELGISPHTCRGYIKSILVKLNAHSQLEAVVTAASRGLLRIG
ncbi:MAG: response regulator transcription factor [Actinomycetes bacterium]